MDRDDSVNGVRNGGAADVDVKGEEAKAGEMPVVKREGEGTG